MNCGISNITIFIKMLSLYYQERQVMNSNRRFRPQRGAVIVTVALTLLFLLGFMGIALDFGRLFIVKTELQTAMDSCALAAAHELDGNATAITRAYSAGRTAGNLNRVNMQSVNWSGQGQLIDAEITFKDVGYAVTTVSANARYAQCQHTQPAIQMWLLKSMGAFSGNTTTYPATGSVVALAVATRGSAQSTCPLPVALHPKSATAGPNYGFAPGEWVTLLNEQNASPGGTIGWANLDNETPGGGANSLRNQLNGFCGVQVGDPLQPVEVPGTIAALVEAWNSRFGIYKNTDSPAEPLKNPDFTGYSYTATNWPDQLNAYGGPAPGAVAPTAENYIAKSAAFASCADSGRVRGGQPNCQSISNLSLNSFQKLATTGEHQQYGRNRRIVTVPVVDAGSLVLDYACMLILQPLTIPGSNIKLEFIGNASVVGSPCTASGLPGGAAGPLVPVLVR